MEDIIYLLALKNIKGVGDIYAARLLERFGSPGSIFNSEVNELLKVDGINKTLANSIVGYSDWDKNRKEADIIQKRGVKVVGCHNPLYPKNLKNIYNHPLLLYYVGDIDRKDDIAIGVVGSRNCDDYGIKITENIVTKLSQRGITVVSGMARGIDTVAHRSALKAGGRTAAVLGSGIDVCYPRENKKLFSKISECGYVMSEFPLGTEPEGVNFPKRNRLISGLSLGVVVIQANSNSGALITAGYAIEQNREVFAIPGNVDNKRNSGANQLIKRGAKLVEDLDDIVEEITEFKTLTGEIDKKKIKRFDITKEENIVFQHLLESKLHVDQIAHKTEIDTVKLFPLLLSMELKGIIRSFPGSYYQAVNS